MSYQILIFDSLKTLLMKFNFSDENLILISYVRNYLHTL